MIIICVTGISGSGKSYLCSLLPNYIKCFDTDDYITKAYDELIKKKKKINDKKIQSLAKKILKNEIKNVEYVVIVGITIKIDNCDHKFFIEMNNKELAKNYKQMIIREIKKYSNIITLIDKIKNMKENEISDMLKYKYHINALDPTEINFNEYKKIYKNALEFEKNNDTIIMSQINIYNNIIHLCRT